MTILPPLLTIITVCYNAESTIAPTLQSLAQQSDQSFEHIIIDGASTDNTLSLVRTLYPRAVVYSAPDNGIYDAMNKGLMYASGSYICYLNAGDTLRSADTIQKICIALNKHRPDLLYGDTMIVDRTYHDLYPRRLRPPKTLTKRSFADGMLICHQAFIPKRDLAPNYDLRYHYSADYDWCIKIIDKIQSQYRVDDYLVNYLHEGMTTQHHRASLLERLSIMGQRYGWLTAISRHVRFIFYSRR